MCDFVSNHKVGIAIGAVSLAALGICVLNKDNILKLFKN